MGDEGITWATIYNVSLVSLTICELTSSDVEVRTCRTSACNA